MLLEAQYEKLGEAILSPGVDMEKEEFSGKSWELFNGLLKPGFQT